MSQGNNLIGNASGTSGLVSSDLRNLDAKLGPLTINGGSTFTHALLESSPAIDAGSASASLVSDQRGTLRPQDGDNNDSVQIDIGAFEGISDSYLSVNNDYYQVDMNQSLSLPQAVAYPEDFSENPEWTLSGSGDAGNLFG